MHIYHILAGRFSDLYSYIPAARTWKALSPIGPPPSPRGGMGIAATPNGMVYIFGGYSDVGELAAWACIIVAQRPMARIERGDESRRVAEKDFGSFLAPMPPHHDGARSGGRGGECIVASASAVLQGLWAAA
jgi:hypothetical protein